MGVSWESLAVGLIVGTAVAWAGRSMWRAGRQKKVCSSCGSAGACPLVNAGTVRGGPPAPCGAEPGADASDRPASPADPIIP